MFSLLQPFLLRHSCRAIYSVGRRVPISCRPILSSSPLRTINVRNVLSRQYSKEKSNDDNGENQSADGTESTAQESSEASTPSRLSYGSALVLPETKLPSYAPMLAYHRIYMPGTATPFDPYAQMKDGEYIALFLSKKNPIYPITSFLAEQKAAETTKSKKKAKQGKSDTTPPTTAAEETHEDSHAASQSETTDTQHEPKATEHESHEQPETLKESETSEEESPTTKQATTETEVNESETETKDTETKDTEIKDTETKDIETKDTEITKDAETPETKETEAADAEHADGSKKAPGTEADSSKEQQPTTASSETPSQDAAKEGTTKTSEGEDKSALASMGLLQKKQAESNGAMIDSTAVYDVGVLAVVDKTSVASPRLRFLLPVRLCGTARPNLGAKIEPHKTEPYDSQEVEELMAQVKSSLAKAMLAFPSTLKVNTSETLMKQKDPNRFVFGLMAEYPSYLAEAQAILSATSVPYRLKVAHAVVETDTAIRQKQQEINKELDERTTKDQREFFLREQLKMVRKELGERDEKEELIEKYRARLTGEVPKEAMKVIDDELAKLQMLEPSSSEYAITRNYLDWLTILPWGIHSKESFDLKHAREVLESEHYGLKDIKSRILEFIAVGSLKGTVQGKIICLIGPPGTGKTSIGKSIANALGRKFYRFSVGGMHDVSEIKGHRRTYVGAMPGKLLQCLKQVKVSNPVILIDEIDKLGRGRQGDPASALLEVLDPEQNASFMDHYLDVPVDLSKVLFICTANVKDTIPKPLLDRMEVMYLSGYIPEEQIQIVKKYLIPSAIKESGLKPEQIVVEDSAVQTLVKSYCREAGVRNLQKHVEKIARKVALKRVRGARGVSVVTDENLADYVGKPIFSSDRYYQQTPPGIVMGLAWTQLGGAALYVETVQDPLNSRAEMRITGQLGDVMKESTSIAYTYAKNHLEVVSPGNRFFEGASLHMHIPEGATPKDGPSAGITMVTSLLSLALNQPVLHNLAMTGELTLTGKVLPIGGVREKCIASKRAGVTRIILPVGNKKDWTDLPVNIKKGLTVYFADYYTDVYDIAFADAKEVPEPDPAYQYNLKTTKTKSKLPTTKAKYSHKTKPVSKQTTNKTGATSTSRVANRKKITLNTKTTKPKSNQTQKTRKKSATA